MGRPIRFGHQFAPTRGWAEAWPGAFRAYFSRVLEAYRERVRTYYVDEYEQQPDAFLLAGPVEVVAVATLETVWIFARPAEVDSIRVEDVWEHEVFADWDFRDAPAEYRRRKVHEVMLGDPDWVLIEEHQVTGAIFILDTPQFYRPEEQGARLADGAASSVRFHLALEGEGSDEQALARVRGELDDLMESTDPQRRGKEFEGVMERLLRAHGCHVERGLPGEAEQIDLFMTEPEYALIECRWEKAPLEAEVIHNLTGKLRTRPAIVVGLYVSMSGFTTGARTTARNAHERAIVLVERDDVLALARGEVTFQAFWRERMRELIVRYPK